LVVFVRRIKSLATLFQHAYFDKSNSLEIDLFECAVSRGCPQGFSQQSLPLVNPDRLHVHAGFRGQLPNSHPIILNPITGYKVKIFCAQQCGSAPA
jgi:hypothetical protein